MYDLKKYCQINPWQLLDPCNDNLYPAIIKDEANHNNEARFFILDNLVVGHLSRQKHGRFWTLGKNQKITAEEIIDASNLAKKIDSSFNGFSLVSKKMLSSTPSDFISLRSSSPNEYEYIYDTHKIAIMKESGHATLRRYVNKFKKLYSDSITIEIYEDDADKRFNDELMNLYQDWLHFSGLSSEALKQETTSFTNYLNLRLKNSYHKPFKIIMRYKGKIVGISINDIVPVNSAINFYMFCNLNLTGISYFMFHETNRLLHEKGIKEFNFQEDLGNTGLQKFKKMLKPKDIYELVEVSASLKK